MLMKAEKSCLLVIDIQQKLTPHVRKYQQLIVNCQWLMKLARELDIPLLISEQYPSGLGATIEEIKEMGRDVDVIDKVHFSCCADDACNTRINALGKEQVIIIGIEAHVCVLQTALDLKAQGKEVFVVTDCVSSRSELDQKFAFERMSNQGVTLVTREMVFFEWIHQAGTVRFKALSNEFLK
jgi:nicotinamidase-related amidase